MEKRYSREIVQRALIDQILRYVPKYHFDELTYQILQRAFEDPNTPDSYTEAEANALLRSIIEQKMMKGEIGGYMYPVEKAIWYLRDKSMHPYKHNAEMGCGEFWTYFIKNWKFSRSKGVDLDDGNGDGIDIKASTKDDGVANVTGQFFDAYGNPIIKKRGDIWYKGEKVYHKKSKDYKGMYRALWSIDSFKVIYPDLKRYIYYHLNGDQLEYIIREKESVEDAVNAELENLHSNMGIDKRINLTHSFFEHGSFIYNYPQFKAI